MECFVNNIMWKLDAEYIQHSNKSQIFNTLIFLQGMELYPRIGENFDIKVFTNCRFGMMSWAVLAVTYCIKQVMPPNLNVNGNSVFTCDYFSSV